jgi:hypothetical protein
MLDKIKYNFWLLLFVGNTVVFLYFLYQAFSFTSLFAYRWVFFLSTPFFTSGIHLLIKFRSTRAEWLSIINFAFIGLMVLYFNAFPFFIKELWAFFSIPIVNQLAINSFDVLWSSKLRFRWSGMILICVAWFLTTLSIALNLQILIPWVMVVTGITGLWCLILVSSKEKKSLY